MVAIFKFCDQVLMKPVGRDMKFISPGNFIKNVFYFIAKVYMFLIFNFWINRLRTFTEVHACMVAGWDSCIFMVAAPMYAMLAWLLMAGMATENLC